MQMSSIFLELEFKIDLLSTVIGYRFVTDLFLSYCGKK